VKLDPHKLIELGKIRRFPRRPGITRPGRRMLLVRNDREAACYELPIREKMNTACLFSRPLLVYTAAEFNVQSTRVFQLVSRP